MMTQTNQKIKKSEEVDDVGETEALKTDEILSILSKTSFDFQKESEISSKASIPFIKKTLKEVAEKTLANSQESEHSPEKDENVSVEKSQDQDIDLEQQEKTVEEKKYTDIEAKKMANDYAKIYYNKGYQLGIKKIKEELAKGDKALAIVLKNTTDSLFFTGPEFSKKINGSLNVLISKTCKEILGHEIDNKTELFLKRIQELSDSLTNSFKKAKVFLNKNDFESIKKFLNENKIDLNQEFLIDETLERGDLKIKSGSIEIDDIVSNKMKFPSEENLENEMNKLQQENKILAENNKIEKNQKSPR